MGKAVDLMNELQKTGDPTHRRLLASIISASFLLQVPVAILGAAIAYLARGAIIAAHNAIQHLYTIAHRGRGVLHPPAKSIVPQYDVGAAVQAASLPGEHHVLLPVIIGGGDTGANTVSAMHYYTLLPSAVLLLWTILGFVSLGVGLWSSIGCSRFYSFLGFPL